MNEEEKFLKFIQSRLEEGCALSQQNLAAIQAVAHAHAEKRTYRKLSWRMRVSALVAASVAVLLGVGSVLFNRASVSRAMIAHAVDCPLARTIEILTDSEDFECLDVEGMDDISALLAWQDDPYRKIENEVIRDNDFLGTFY